MYVISQNISEQHRLWMDIQDIILVRANDWPHVRKILFRTKNIIHFQRILSVAFVYVNGLHIDLMLQSCILSLYSFTQINRKRQIQAYMYFSLCI